MWTQGSCFCFDRGDTLYDTKDAYLIWSEALKHLNICISVKDTIPVSPASDNNPRDSGRVKFELLTPDKSRTKLIGRFEYSLSQDEFVKLLICGPSDDLKDKWKAY